jgi:ligand-binding sensor domain-containing protein
MTDRYVWAGRCQGLRRYDKLNKTYELFDSHNSPIDGEVVALALDGETLWVSAPPTLLTYKDGKFSTPVALRQVAAAEVLTMAADAKGLCLGTREAGLHVLDKATGKWQVFDTKSGLPTNSIRRVAMDEKSIWVAFGDDPLGVGKYDRAACKWSFYTYRAGVPCDHLFCLTSQAGQLYVGTMVNGFWRYDIAADAWHNLNLGHRADFGMLRMTDVYCILPDASGLWLGSNHGLFRYEPAWGSYRRVEGLDGLVSALAQDGEMVLCGTKRQGLMAYDNKGQSWRDFGKAYGPGGADPLGSVTALACDASGIWVGGESGLALLERSTGKRAQLPAELAAKGVTAILLRAGQVWVGTSDGVWQFDPRTNQLKAHLAAGHYVTALHAIARGILIGTRGGLALAQDGAGTVVWEPRLSANLIGALATDDTSVWVGTLGQGLIRAAAIKPDPTPR